MYNNHAGQLMLATALFAFVAAAHATDSARVSENDQPLPPPTADGTEVPAADTPPPPVSETAPPPDSLLSDLRIYPSF